MTTPQVPTIFARSRIVARTARARALLARDPAAAPLFGPIAQDLAERIAFLRHAPGRVLLDGLGTAGLALPDATVTSTGEADLGAPLPWHEDDFDTVISIGTLDTVNDLPGALIQLRALLAPGGLLLAAFCGAGSLPRLHRALLAAESERPAARLHPQIDLRACPALLQRAGWADPVADSYTLTARYPGLGALVADLRAHGWGNALRTPAPPLTRAALARAETAFAEAADSDGKVAESFEIITLTGWRR